MNSGMEKEIFEIYVEDIIPNRFQPRLSFDEKSLQDLSNSIKEHGIIQPLVLRKIGDKYEIIAGERRYKASIMAGLQKVPAVLMTLDDNQSAEIAVVENTQRKDLTALEEARSYKKLLDRKYLTQEQLASRMGKSQSYISNKMRLLNLDDEVQEALLQEKISERHARSLLSLSDPIQQKETLNKIITGKLTVKQTDDMIKAMTGAPSKTPVTPTEILETLEPFTSKPIFTPEVAPTQVAEPTLETTPPEPIESFVKEEKEEAIDINQNQEHANIEGLLNQTNEAPIKQEIESTSELASKEEPINTNKFITAIDMETDEADMGMGDILAVRPEEMAQPVISPETEVITPIVTESFDEIQPVSETYQQPIQPPLETNTNDIIQEYRNSQQSITPNQSIEAGNLNSAISFIRESGKMLGKNGFILDIEEFDFENLYQLIIKIQKK